MPRVAALWFLPAYFIGKNVYILIKRLVSNPKLLGLICLGLSIGAMIVDNYVVYLPFAINQGISTIFYFFIGNNIDVKNINKKYIIITIALWIIGLFVTEMNVAFSSLDKFTLIGILGTVGAYYILIKIVVLFQNFQNINIIKGMNTMLQYLGFNSLYIFVLHYLIMISLFGYLKARGYVAVSYIMAIMAPVGIFYLNDVLRKRLKKK